MSSDPNYPPPGSPPPPLPYPDAAAASVRPAAISLVVYNGLSILYLLLSVVAIGPMRDMFRSMAEDNPQMEQVAQMYDAPWIVPLCIVECVVAIVALIGSVRMLQMKSYGMAMTGAVLTLINIGGCCCLIGIGFGIWALVVLMKPEVQAAFRRT